MKLINLAFFALLILNVKSDQDLMKIVQDCKSSVGATDEDLGKIILRAKPENQEQKCMVSCLLIAMNIVSFRF